MLGIDPAAASVGVARTKVCADRVQWLVGTAEDAAAHRAHREHYDLATMTANAAQVFLGDDEWLATHDERVESTSTLRFRSEEALRRSLARVGLADVQVRHLPSAPGRGWLVVARARPVPDSDAR